MPYVIKKFVMKLFRQIRANTIIYFTLLLFLFCSFQHALSQQIRNDVLVLRGGTLLDLDAFGKSFNDVANSVIIIEGGTIKEAGEARSVTIPRNSKVIDVKGHYIMPGLIDGFATINDQSYANAFLYHGVTTIVGLPHDNRRGELFTTANPSPKIRLLEDFRANLNFGRSDVKPAYRDKRQIYAFIDSLADEGVNVLWVPYGTQPFQLPLIVEACNRRGIVAIGELGAASYRDAIKAGIHSFVHSSRYSAEILPDSIRQVYNKTPFGAGLKLASEYLESVAAETDSTLLQYATELGNSKTGLIPTFSLLYSIFPFAKNPWKMAAASLINPDSVHLPLERETGKWKEPRWSLKYAENLLRFDNVYYNRGAKYLTGSATDAFGTLPGISMHSELEMLAKAGLSNREALAAATTNFSEIYHWNDIGQLKKGAAADILVLSKNPVESLENLRDIKMILLNGETIERENLLK